jgi:hypothetical protein
VEGPGQRPRCCSVNLFQETRKQEAEVPQGFSCSLLEELSQTWGRSLRGGVLLIPSVSGDP